MYKIISFILLVLICRCGFETIAPTTLSQDISGWWYVAVNPGDQVRDSMDPYEAAKFDSGIWYQYLHSGNYIELRTWSFWFAHDSIIRSVGHHPGAFIGDVSFRSETLLVNRDGFVWRFRPLSFDTLPPGCPDSIVAVDMDSLYQSW